VSNNLSTDKARTSLLCAQRNPLAATLPLNINLTSLNDIQTTDTNSADDKMAPSTPSAVTKGSKQTTTTSNTTAGTPTTNYVFTDTDIDLSESSIEDTVITTAKKDTATHAPVVEYEEDLIDYDEDELEPATHDNGDGVLIDIEDKDINLEDDPTSAKTKSMAEEHAENSKAIQEAAKQRLEQAKYMMTLGPQTLLTSSTDMATALQLINLGDTVTVKVPINSVIYEITWKIAGFQGIQQPIPNFPSTTTTTVQRKTCLRNAPPLSNSSHLPPHTAYKYCRFGRNCQKGTSCPFQHAVVKSKLCTWINTPQGCTQGAGCSFSHENDGVKCTLSAMRLSCANGLGCAFKHDDDVGRAHNVDEALGASVEVGEVLDTGRLGDGPVGSKSAGMPFFDADTGMNNAGAQESGKVVGSKRGREQHDDGGDATQYKRVNDYTGKFKAGTWHPSTKQHQGRGRGSGRVSNRGSGRGSNRGSGRGRGSVVARGGMRIKGAASGGQ
jgi:hypothetical protein